jgi:hypothetical protein
MFRRDAVFGAGYGTAAIFAKAEVFSLMEAAGRELST